MFRVEVRQSDTAIPAKRQTRKPQNQLGQVRVGASRPLWPQGRYSLEIPALVLTEDSGRNWSKNDTGYFLSLMAAVVRVFDAFYTISSQRP